MPWNANVRLLRMKLKICVVGERGVGKTSLILRFTKKTFNEDYHGTLGAYLYPVEMELKGDAGEIIQAKVAIFDLMGEHSIRESFRDAIFYGTHGVLAVCDVERPQTLYAVQDWVRAVSLVTGGVPFHIAVNKFDLAEKIAFGPAETEWLRKSMPAARLILTSARTGKSVDKAFTDLVSQIVSEMTGAGHRRRVKTLARQKILAFVARRMRNGVSKMELLTGFKELDHNELMEEVDNLVRLGILQKEESGPASFRVVVTERGQDLAASNLWEELVVDEPS
ncbi:MAG: Rab family GTPase [Candidatus Thermoplasmatota archaeon]